MPRPGSYILRYPCPVKYSSVLTIKLHCGVCTVCYGILVIDASSAAVIYPVDTAVIEV